MASRLCRTPGPPSARRAHGLRLCRTGASFCFCSGVGRRAASVSTRPASMSRCALRMISRGALRHCRRIRRARAADAAPARPRPRPSCRRRRMPWQHPLSMDSMRQRHASRVASATADPEPRGPTSLPTPPTGRSGLDFPVVGIGASAGGLAAIKTLLEGLPAAPDMAFVVVLHLSPTHESNAAAIFQMSTRMPVTQVNGRMKIERNHVYVIPPTHDLSMVDGSLALVPSRAAARQARRHRPFFRTLAEAHRERAIGIVLSGTGADGSAGIGRLKEHGGIVIAQIARGRRVRRHAERAPSPPARSTSSCRSPRLPDRLVQLWSNARRIEIPDAEKVSTDRQAAAAPAVAEEALRDIMKMLQQRTGHDFKQLQAGDGAAPDRAADAGQRPARRSPPTGASCASAGREPKALLERHADRRDPVLPRPPRVRGAGARGPAEAARERGRGRAGPRLGRRLLDRRGGVLDRDAAGRRGGAAAARPGRVHGVRHRHRRRGDRASAAPACYPEGDRRRRAAEPPAHLVLARARAATASARRCATP